MFTYLVPGDLEARRAEHHCSTFPTSEFEGIGLVSPGFLVTDGCQEDQVECRTFLANQHVC